MFILVRSVFMHFLARFDFGMLIFTLLSTFTRFRDIFFPLLEIRTDKVFLGIFVFLRSWLQQKNDRGFREGSGDFFAI